MLPTTPAQITFIFVLRNVSQNTWKIREIFGIKFEQNIKKDRRPLIYIYKKQDKK